MLKPKKILLTEDDLVLRETITELFTQAQFQVTEATNGLEALAFLEKERFDLLVTDLHMQPMDGMTLLENIRSQAKWNTLPVIILTADPLHELRIKGLEQGVNDYLNKPFMFKELLLRCQNLMGILESTKKDVQNASLSTLPEAIQQKMEDGFLQRLNQYLLQNLSSSIDIDALADHCRLSRSGLDKKMRHHLDMSPSHYIRQYKLEKARDMLQKSHLSVKEISQLTGFNSLSYFSTCYTRQFGYSPTKYRK